MASSAPKTSNNIFRASPGTSSQPPAINPFANAQTNKPKPFQNNDSGQSKSPFESVTISAQVKPNQHSKAAGFNPPAGPKSTGSSTPRPLGAQSGSQQTNGHGDHGRKAKHSTKSWPGTQSGGHTGQKKTSPKTPPQGPPSEFASKIYKQLAKDGIKPPQWPSDPEALKQKSTMDELRHGHRAYREKVRKSLMKADLVDDPDKRRRLDEALPFKGICEEMCPEWEQIQRIVENGLWGPEGYEENGVRVPVRKQIIKRLARSAAGQEAALPMDVRSPAACRRTLDYLVDELISFDDRLPTYHHFAWDRTRAIRIDLSMQTPSMTPDEMKDEIYVLETIVRFHATSAHLLARSWFKYKDYSEQQEVEQLSKTLMTLKQRYKDCGDMGIMCENEAEFLAYYVVFFGWDSSLKETVESWGEEISDSEAIQTAMCVVEAMQNTTMLHGPLKPESSTELALNAASIFFSIVASPQISYTMACIAEVHFSTIRQTILRTIVRSYARPKGAPKDITAEFVRRQLRFDTEDDAVAFVELHDLEFKEENGTRYLFIGPRQQLKRPRVPQVFSHDIVERKRSNRPFPDVIHETVYEDVTTGGSETFEEDGLFVGDSKDVRVSAHDTVATESDLEDTETAAGPASELRAASIPFGTATNQQSMGSGIAPSHFLPVAGLGQESTRNPTTAGNHLGAATGFQAATKPQTNPFGGSLIAAGATKTSDAADAGKRVTFGETSVKYIESRKDVDSITSTGTTPSGVFDFLNNGASKTPPDAPKTGSAPWFPTSSADYTTPTANYEGQSIFSGASATSDSGFRFPSSGNVTPAPGSAALNLSSHPTIHTTQPADPKAPSPVTTGPKPSFFPNPTASNTTSSAYFPSSLPPFSTPPTTQASPSPVALPTPLVHATGTSAPATATSATNEQRPKKGNFENFAKWFVCGDRGMLDDLEEWVVETLLRDTWTNFMKMEEERERKEEDEKSWAEARKFRTHSLSVTYFYRWLDTFRKRRAISRIRLERDKFRNWNAPENVAKRQANESNAKRMKHDEVVDLLQQKARGRARQEDKLRQSIGSRDSVEDALLASGIFNGVRNPRPVARLVAMGDETETNSSPMPSEMLYRQESKRRERHGLPPLPRIQQPPRVYKEGSKAARLQAQFAGKDTLSVSTGSFRNSTLNSSFRSSLGFNSSRVSKIKKSRVSDPYWRMKANGLVQMPNGDYLHESLAIPMLRDGKRFPGVGDYGIVPSESGSPSMSAAGDELFDESPSLILDDAHRSRVSPSPSIISNISSKRKRASYHPSDFEDEDLAAYRSEASASIRKRARSSGSTKNEPDLLAQMQNLLQDVQAEGKKAEGR